MTHRGSLCEYIAGDYKSPLRDINAFSAGGASPSPTSILRLISRPVHTFLFAFWTVEDAGPYKKGANTPTNYNLSMSLYAEKRGVQPSFSDFIGVCSHKHQYEGAKPLAPPARCGFFDAVKK
jgi:hypothetical protein